VTCAEFSEVVAAFLDDALDDDAERRFVGHIPTCEGCERYLAQLRQTIAMLADLPVESARPVP
jgi:anti-sigma factor RsiW